MSSNILSKSRFFFNKKTDSLKKQRIKKQRKNVSEAGIILAYCRMVNRSPNNHKIEFCLGITGVVGGLLTSSYVPVQKMVRSHIEPQSYDLRVPENSHRLITRVISGHKGRKGASVTAE